MTREILKPYQSIMDVQPNLSRVQENNISETKRDLTHLGRYVLREGERGRVDTSRITGRAWIGRKGLALK